MRCPLSRFAQALCCAALGLIVAAPAVRADNTEADFQAAARAYREGQVAQSANDAAEAARWFELADSIAPSPQALRNAIRSHLAAEQRTRAATLALSAQDRYVDRETRSLVRQVLNSIGSKLARVSVHCGQPCELLCDGQALTARPASDFDVFIEPGEHVLNARFDMREAVQQKVELSAGERLVLSLETVSTGPHDGSLPSSFAVQPLASDKMSAPSTVDNGAPAWMFWTSAGLTAVSAGALLVSGLDTLQRHDDYLRGATEDGYARGIQSQRRTNLLFLSTGVLSALTVGLAFFTDWDGDETTLAPRVSASLDGASLSIGRRF
jgi:hypothetical protein